MTLKGKLFKLLVLFVILSLVPMMGMAKKKKKNQKDEPVYVFKIDTQIKHTPVKNQYRTGTCWCFTTVSFLESELLRMGKEELDLSEMYVVRNTYPHKVMNYMRLHGNANHSQGGQSHDVFNQVKRYGIVPESVYSGMNIDEKRHNHGEMVSVLQGLVDGVLKKRGKRITPRWLEAYEAVLDVYLGKVPESFQYKGKTYTPTQFANDYLELNMDDYIELTSYTHHPFYKKCRIELPDNWDYNSDYYNVPIDDLEKIADHALKNGFSIAWDGDVSEKFFSKGRSSTENGSGYAVVPETNWDDKTRAERKKEITEPIKEKEISQKMRQKTFDNFTTTDDHLMHIFGLAHDQKGTKYYYTKNSGGADNAYNGYIYMSRSYLRLKTTVIAVHKDALPKEIKEKLGL
jgi:bleomycin hydrolase